MSARFSILKRAFRSLKVKNKVAHSGPGKTALLTRVALHHLRASMDEEMDKLFRLLLLDGLMPGKKRAFSGIGGGRGLAAARMVLTKKFPGASEEWLDAWTATKSKPPAPSELNEVKVKALRRIVKKELKMVPLALKFNKKTKTLSALPTKEKGWNPKQTAMVVAWLKANRFEIKRGPKLDASLSKFKNGISLLAPRKSKPFYQSIKGLSKFLTRTTEEKGYDSDDLMQDVWAINSPEHPFSKAVAGKYLDKKVPSLAPGVTPARYLGFIKNVMGKIQANKFRKLRQQTVETDEEGNETKSWQWKERSLEEMTEDSPGGETVYETPMTSDRTDSLTLLSEMVLGPMGLEGEASSRSGIMAAPTGPGPVLMNLFKRWVGGHGARRNYNIAFLNALQRGEGENAVMAALAKVEGRKFARMSPDEKFQKRRYYAEGFREGVKRIRSSYLEASRRISNSQKSGEDLEREDENLARALDKIRKQTDTLRQFGKVVGEDILDEKAVRMREKYYDVLEETERNLKKGMSFDESLSSSVQKMDPTSSPEVYISKLRENREILKRLLFISSFNGLREDGVTALSALKQSAAKIYKIKSFKPQGSMVRGKPVPQERTKEFYKSILQGPVREYREKMMGRVRTGERRARAEKLSTKVLSLVEVKLKDMTFFPAVAEAVSEIDPEYKDAPQGGKDDIVATYRELFDELPRENSEELFFLSHYYRRRRGGESHEEALRTAVSTVVGERGVASRKDHFEGLLDPQDKLPPALQKQPTKTRKKKDKATEEALSSTEPAVARRAAVFIEEGGKEKFLKGWTKVVGTKILPQIHLEEMEIGKALPSKKMKEYSVGEKDDLLVLGYAEDERMQLFVLRPKYPKKGGKRNDRVDGLPSYIIVATDGSTPPEYAKTLLEDWTRKRAFKVWGTMGYVDMKGKRVGV